MRRAALLALAVCAGLPGSARAVDYSGAILQGILNGMQQGLTNANNQNVEQANRDNARANALEQANAGLESENAALETRNEEYERQIAELERELQAEQAQRREADRRLKLKADKADLLENFKGEAGGAKGGAEFKDFAADAEAERLWSAHRSKVLAVRRAAAEKDAASKETETWCERDSVRAPDAAQAAAWDRRCDPGKVVPPFTRPALAHHDDFGTLPESSFKELDEDAAPKKP